MEIRGTVLGAAIVVAFGAGLLVRGWLPEMGSDEASAEESASAKCTEVEDAVRAASEAATAAQGEAETFAATHTMYPAESKFFPDLWTARVLGEPTDRDEWARLLQQARASWSIPMRVVDDSPDCFSPTDVATARQWLDQMNG